MSWTMADIKSGIGEALSPIARTYSEAVPSQVQVPCFIIGEGDIVYEDTFGDGDHITFGVLLLFSRADAKASQKQLSEYRQRAGSLSVISAIEASPTLPYQGTATAESVAVKESSAPGDWEIAGVTYIGTEFTVEVLAS